PAARGALVGALLTSSSSGCGRARRRATARSGTPWSCRQGSIGGPKRQAPHGPRRDRRRPAEWASARPGTRRRSVGIAGLQEVDAVAGDAVGDAVLLGQAARPDAGPQVLQRLGLANALEGIANDGLDEVEGPQRDAAVRLHPVAQVLAELG